MFAIIITLQSMEPSEMGSHDLSNMADVRSAMCHVVETEVWIM